MITDQLDLLTIADKVIEKEKLNYIDVQFKQVLRGRARYGTRKITIPLWLLERAKEYQIFYIIHEVSHFINYDTKGYTGHDNNLKRIEQKILKEYHIYIKYAKAYPKWLCNAQGEKICDNFGHYLTK
jgi:predicted SprT family Zn-dependent metalloprotease